MLRVVPWYRVNVVNTKADGGIAYDPIPFVPALGADFFGHMVHFVRMEQFRSVFKIPGRA